MDELLLISLAVLALIGIILITFLKNKGTKDKPSQPETNQQNVVPDARARRLQGARNQRARLRVNARNQAEGNDENFDDNNAAPAEVPNDIDPVEFEKMGAKKRAKLEAKAEKKAHREAEEKSREEKKKRQAAEDEERRKQSEREALEEKRREEEQRKIQEEKERRDHEEYLKMKAAFSVEEEGYLEGESENPENLLQEFVRYIKTNKVVILEDLASNFKMKTQSVIDRIQDLQKDGLLTGVIDDRGKFIYITEDELKDVAKFIKQRGRISIAELAESSNQLIHLVTRSGRHI
ncbi:DDRGK domain-containing protein 1 [Chrysoperla carnea]|uniref:DDRGK domain-containing protein 1 n=1 Tax=Chrysoperla carnea TaxID=189513 RepID=UPI001D06F5DF|nr:DDRGK domain-containing protein 1 [Chrysoperla carnea]